MKKHNPDIRIWAMEPAESPLITAGYCDSHNIQGIGANFIPQNLDLTLVDQTITVTADEAIEMSRKLSRKAGLLVGISSGANVCAAIKMAEQITGKIVTVLPDTGERYLSTSLFEDI